MIDPLFASNDDLDRMAESQGAPDGRPWNSGPKFKLELLADMAPTFVGEWRIKRLLPAHGLAAIYGPPGCGKSFVALVVALHIAAGRDWSGCRVHQAGAVYVAAEGGPGFRKRVVAALAHFDIPPTAPFALVTTAPNLGTGQDDAATLIGDIRSQTKGRPFGLGVVVIDTLARTMTGADESSSRDMGIFIQNADRIARELGCVVVVVHHTGKVVERGMRGSNALHGATDAEWEVATSEQGARTLRITKMKDGEDGLSWMFRLDVEEVGEDEDGDPVTTCVCEVVNNPEQASAADRATSRKRPTGQAAEFLKAVRKALDEIGERPPASNHMAGATRVVTRLNLSRYTEKLGFVEGKTEEVRRTTLNRHIRTLAGNGHLGQWGDFVWIP